MTTKSEATITTVTMDDNDTSTFAQTLDLSTGTLRRGSNGFEVVLSVTSDQLSAYLKGLDDSLPESFAIQITGAQTMSPLQERVASVKSQGRSVGPARN